MRIKIFADGADLETMHQMSLIPQVKGFTTNPTLMKSAGVVNFHAFAAKAIQAFPRHPISLEVFSDDFTEMEFQAFKIASWGDNVFVKIPICNTKGEKSAPLIGRLTQAGIKVNVTAVMCAAQVDDVFAVLGNAPAIVSIFAGRIADTGRNPASVILHALRKKVLSTHEILWASPRQVLDVYTAEGLGCDVITCTPEIIKKLSLEGKNLLEYSRETVKMFWRDAKEAGYQI